MAPHAWRSCFECLCPPPSFLDLRDYLYATLLTAVLRSYWVQFSSLSRLASHEKIRTRQDSSHLPPEIIQVHNPTGPRCPAKLWKVYLFEGSVIWPIYLCLNTVSKDLLLWETKIYFFGNLLKDRYQTRARIQDENWYDGEKLKKKKYIGVLITRHSKSRNIWNLIGLPFWYSNGKSCVGWSGRPSPED